MLVAYLSYATSHTNYQNNALKWNNLKMKEMTNFKIFTEPYSPISVPNFTIRYPYQEILLVSAAFKVSNDVYVTIILATITS